MFKLSQVELAFGSLKVFDKFSLSSNKKELVCLFGPSGIGKTSVLNLLAGLIKPDSGEVEVKGSKIGYVFQDARLLPWCTVKDNISIGLYAQKVSPEVMESRAEELIHKLNLDGFASYYPSQLSGGMKQRVALGRAFAIEPDLLLMDEPFAALDENLKGEMRELLVELIKWNSCTTVFVTHNFDEAMQLADRIVVMNGRPCTVKEIINIDASLRSNTKYKKEIRSQVFLNFN